MQVVDNYLKYLQNHTKVITNVFLIFWITMLQITKQKKDVQVNEFVLLNLEQQKCMHLSLQGCHTPIKAKCFQNFSCAFILASKYNFYPTTTAHTDIPLPIYSQNHNPKCNRACCKNFIPLLGCPQNQNLLQSQKIVAVSHHKPCHIF